MYEDEGTRGGLEELKLLVVAMVGREQGGVPVVPVGEQ